GTSPSVGPRPARSLPGNAPVGSSPQSPGCAPHATAISPLAKAIPEDPAGRPQGQSPHASTASPETLQTIQSSELAGSSGGLRGGHSRFPVGPGVAIYQQRSRTGFPHDEGPSQNLRLLSHPRGRSSPRPHSQLHLHSPQTRLTRPRIPPPRTRRPPVLASSRQIDLSSYNWYCTAYRSEVMG